MITALGGLLVALLAIVLLLVTQAGARFVINRAVAKVPFPVTVGRIEGRLIGPLRLYEIDVQHSGGSTTVARMEIAWKLRRLYSRTLHIDRLVIEGVTTSLAKQEAEASTPHSAASAEPRKPIASPLEVIVGEARITGVQLLSSQLAVKDLQLSLGGRLEDYQLQLSARLEPHSLPAVAISLQARGSLEQLDIERLDARSLEGEISLRGQTRWYPTMSWEVAADIDSMHPGLLAEDPQLWPGWISAQLRSRGQVEASGDLSAWAAVDTLQGEFRGKPVNGKLEGDWSADKRAALKLDLNLAELNLRAMMSLADSIEADLEFRLDGLNTFLPEFAGNLQLDTQIRGPRNAPRVTAMATVDSLRSDTLSVDRGRATIQLEISDLARLLDARSDSNAALLLPPMNVELDVSMDSTRFRQFSPSSKRADMKLDLNFSALNLRAMLSLADSIDTDLEFRLEGLNTSSPQFAGNVQLDAQIRGPRNAPRVTATAAVDSLNAGTLSVDRGSATIQLEISELDRFVRARSDSSASILLPPMNVELDVSMDSTRFRQYSLSSTRLQLDGSTAEHRFKLDTRGADVAAMIEFAGGFDLHQRRWSGSLDSLRVLHPVTGPWALCQPVELDVAALALKVDQFCLAQDGAHLTLSAALADSAWTCSTTMEGLPLAMAARRLPQGKSLRGTLKARAEAQGKLDGSYQLQLDAGLSAGRLLYTLDDVPDSLTLEPVQVQIEGGPQGVTGQFSLTLNGSNPQMYANFQGQLALPEFDSLLDSLPTQPFTLELNGNVPELALLNGFSSRLTENQGSVSLTVALSGQLAAPAVSVDLKVVDASTSLVDLGMRLQDIQLETVGDMQSGYTVRGRMRSGKGVLAIDGSIPPKPSSDSPIQVSVKGERFKLVNTPELDIEASPDVSLTFDMKRLDLKGTVLLPLVHVGLVEMPETAVTPSNDVILADDAGQQSPMPIDTWIDMKVELGDDVLFRGFAFSAKLSGSLRVEQHVPLPPYGSGQIRITEGFYRAYGQNLTIENGLVSFAGPLSNPSLNIRAFRTTSDNVIAGLHITGTPEAPNLKIYSEPAMQESEAIAYLVTGRGLGTGADSGNSSVGGAAAFLGTNVLSNRLGSKMGLDEASVQNDETLDEAALVAGKYISPQIYLSYAMGLFERSNLVRIRYILSPSWAVQAETGSSQGADLFYKFELGGPD